MFNIRKITCMNYDRYKILNKAMKRKFSNIKYMCVYIYIYNEKHKVG